jgi:poly(3-hydroxybutyrate) depolymerase
MPVPNGQLLATYSPYTMHVTGKTLDSCFSVAEHDRMYYVWLPKDYDPSKAYRVTFLFMGCGDRNAAATATYKLMTKDPQSIYVAMNMPPDGLPPLGKPCYDNTIGKDSVEWEFMGLVASKIQKDFCVDENRLFVSGYSSGAWVSNMFGCYFAGKDPSRKFGADISVRGQASVTGGPVFPDVQCGGKVAALWIHDSDDKENIIGGNLGTSLPRVLDVNGCAGGVNGQTAPWGSTPGLNSVCKQYTSCPAAYPVIFCATSGKGHSSQDELALPGFIEFQNLMNAK